MCLRVCARVCIYVYVCVSVVCARARVCVYMRACVRAFVCVRMYVYVYLHICANPSQQNPDKTAIDTTELYLRGLKSTPPQKKKKVDLPQMTISSLSRPNLSNDRQEINNGLILPYWEVCGCVRVYSKGFVTAEMRSGKLGHGWLFGLVGGVIYPL